MAHLAKLKFSDKQRSQVKMTVEERLRHKLIDRLKEQRELAEADLNGVPLVKTRYKMIKDEETNKTLNRENSVLSQIVKHAVKRGYLTKENAPTIEREKEDHSRRPHFTRDDAPEKLVKIGTKVIRHGRFVTFHLAEVTVPRSLFRKILSLIDDLRRRPVPA